MLSYTAAGAQCMSFKSGQVACIGGSASCGKAQLGTEEADDYTPRLMNIQDVRDLAMGSAATCAVKRDGRVSCWGDTTDWGADIETCQRSPEELIEGIDNAVAIAADNRSFAALLANGIAVGGDDARIGKVVNTIARVAADDAALAEADLRDCGLGDTDARALTAAPLPTA